MAKKYFHIFYDPRHKDKIIAQSTEKNALEFPSIKSEVWYNVLQHLEVITENGVKKIKVKVGYWDDPANINLKLTKK